MDHTTLDSEFLRPLVTGWMNKLESSSVRRKEWKEIADECMMFYNNSAKAMWDPIISKKFWKDVKLPRFRVTINKAFEMVAIFGPNLFWEVPHRLVECKRQLALDPEMFGVTPEMLQQAEQQAAQQAQMMPDMMGMGQMGMDQPGMMPGMMPQPDPMVVMYQQMMQAQQQSERQDRVVEKLMDRWLNYTPREQPGGGLAGHSMRCVVDSLIKGRGVLATRPYQMPGSQRTLTGSFRVRPDYIYLDPDFDSVDECRWMAIKHVDTHTEVERRFNLEKNSLKNVASLESSWNHGELSTDDEASSRRRAGQTSDLVVWYEVFSKSGVGCVNTTMEPTIREHMDRVVGQHAYIAVCAGSPHPLNLSAESLRRGATDEQVKEAFSWPIPTWADDRWPVEFLDYYHDPESAWPVAPMAPGLGELKLLNFLMSWFANRTWKSSRDFWAVAQPHLEHYKEYILGGDDQSIIPTPVGLKTPKEAIEILTQPEMRQDMTQLIGFVSDMFDKRVGLTPTIYGQNENNTQNRTAEETSSKNRAVQARPEFMQKQVVDWQSRVASAEALVTRLFITAEDVQGLLGPAGAYLWQQHIASADLEQVVRQFNYTIGASSIRRPNRERDIGNFQTVMGQFAPVMMGVGQATGNYESFNGLMQKWGELHDMKMDDLMIPPPEGPSPEQQEFEQQSQQLELAEKQAKVGKLNAEAQAKTVESQMKPIELQVSQQQAASQLQMEELRQQGEQSQMQIDLAVKQLEMELAQVEASMKLDQDAEEHDQDLFQDAEMHEQEMEQKRETARLDLALKREQAKIQQEAAKAKAAQVKSQPSPKKSATVA